MKNTTPKRKKDYTIVTSYEVYKDMLLFLCGTGMRFGDLITLRVDDKEFDYVVLSHVLEHVQNIKEFTSEVERIAKAGYIELPTKLADNLVICGD